MKAALALFSILCTAHSITAQCPALKHFTTTLVPACGTQDLIIKWPNYRDQSSYYVCEAVNKPVLKYCPTAQYFIYILQECGSCAQYIAPVPCSQLRTENPPHCIAISNDGDTSSASTDSSSSGSTVTLPTPRTPSPTTIPPSESTTETTTSYGIPTPGNSGIQGPPTPASLATDVPFPPTAIVTPPNIELTPPTSVN